MTGFNHFSPIPLAHPNTHDIGIVTGVPLESERIELQPGVTIATMVTASSLLTAGFRVRGDQGLLWPRLCNSGCGCLDTEKEQVYN